MPITYQTEDTDLPRIRQRETNIWIKEVAHIHRKKTGEIAFIFCSDKKILEINNQYLQHDYYTDIITFDYSEKDIISGDIFISLDTVKSNSEKFNTHYNEELHRVIIHGILHLCGLKDKSPEEEKKMREKENEALQLIL
ncbi:MAG: rRNA maturation RNase YbeY [Dysgonamonadaceae bacterium]|jgi:rRNA maturation RNase YbeY|nr:rRNA maturation RNase YbeY [Dysgonamonadaceae bacterium]